MLAINNYPTQYSSKNYNKPTFKQNYINSSSKTKKYAVGAASFIVPGLGQVINGETPKGIAFCLGMLCNGLLFVRRNGKKSILGAIGCLGICGWATYDAYKNA